MATLEIDDTTLTVQLTRGEKIAGLLGDVTVPRSAVSGVSVVENGLKGLRGMRAPGTGMPGVAAIGTWRGKGRKEYVVARRRPALRIELTGQPYAALVLDLPQQDLAALARDLG